MGTVPMIEVNRLKARELAREYEQAATLPDRQEADVVAAIALKLIARGKSVLDLRQVFRETGWLPSGFPVMAIAKAHVAEIQFDCWGANKVSFRPNKFVSTTKGGAIDFEVPRQFFPERPSARSVTAVAAVPSIPPRFRPRNLTDHYILWEADWTLPPRDPFLLKRIRSSWLFRVKAHWDLTDVERAVLDMRLR